MALRRYRWPRAARPKRVSPPREPSLLSLVKAGDAWALQKRVCGQHWGNLEVPGFSEFWTKQWPGLLREACKTKDESCLRVLLTLSRTGGMPAPELPSPFLGWLIQGMLARGDRFSGLHATTQYLIYDRVRGSKMSLRKADGLAILAQGGLGSALYQMGGDQDKTPEVRNLPTVVDAWQRWCAKADHRKAGLDMVRELAQASSFIADGRDAFRSLVEGAPNKYGQELINEMAGKLRYMSFGTPKISEALQRMGLWYKLYQTQGWNTSHETWTQWGVGFSQAVSEITAPGDEVASAWAETLLNVLPEKAPTGWTWHAGVCRGYFIGRSNHIVEPLSRYNNNIWMGQAHFDVVDKWLRENHRVWDRLVSLGLETQAGWENWKQSQALAMDQNWERQMDQMVAHHATHSEAQGLVKTWAQWKARDMALRVGHAYTDEPERRTLKM